MREHLILFAALTLPIAALSQPARPPSSEEEVAIGWTFWDCSDFYLLSSEETQSTNAPLSSEFARLRRESHAAALVLVGEERFRIEATSRERDFRQRLNEATAQHGIKAIKAVSARCKEHMEKYIPLALPKIQALSDRLDAEKRR